MCLPSAFPLPHREPCIQHLHSGLQLEVLRDTFIQGLVAVWSTPEELNQGRSKGKHSHRSNIRNIKLKLIEPLKQSMQPLPIACNLVCVPSFDYLYQALGS